MYINLLLGIVKVNDMSLYASSHWDVAMNPEFHRLEPAGGRTVCESYQYLEFVIFYGRHLMRTCEHTKYYPSSGCVVGEYINFAKLSSRRLFGAVFHASNV